VVIVNRRIDRCNNLQLRRVLIPIVAFITQSTPLKSGGINRMDTIAALKILIASYGDTDVLHVEKRLVKPISLGTGTYDGEI